MRILFYFMLGKMLFLFFVLFLYLWFCNLVQFLFPGCRFWKLLLLISVSWKWRLHFHDCSLQILPRICRQRRIDGWCVYFWRELWSGISAITLFCRWKWSVTHRNNRLLDVEWGFFRVLQNEFRGIDRWEFWDSFSYELWPSEIPDSYCPFEAWTETAQECCRWWSWDSWFRLVYKACCGSSFIFVVF